MKVITVVTQTNGKRDFREGYDHIKDTKNIETYHFAHVTEIELETLKKRIPDQMDKILNNL